MLDPQKRHATLVREHTLYQQRKHLLEQLERDASAIEDDNSADVTSPEQQLGNSLSFSYIKKRLMKCNPNFHFERSINKPDRYCLYLLGGGRKDFVMAMEAGYSPERSVRAVREEELPDPNNPEGTITHRVPYKEATRGWRTVLARLIRKRLITVEQARRYFPINKGHNSRNWHRLMNT